MKDVFPYVYCSIPKYDCQVKKRSARLMPLNFLTIHDITKKELLTFARNAL
jgi:hypothetical protein